MNERPLRPAQARKKRRWIAAVPVAVLLVLCIVCAVYLGTYYHAGEVAVASLEDGLNYTVFTVGGNLVYMPEKPIAGLIFYPGGKVEHTAYAPLMSELCERGILCVLVKMPFRLAVLDSRAADGVRDAFPEVEDWYMGGHSLGGAMAAAYLAKHPDDFRGLVLLGAYSTADLSDGRAAVLSVYGSEDGIMNRGKYEANKGNLPSDFTEIEIPGACHAGFGDYGVQSGDGTPTIPGDEQRTITADAILAFVLRTAASTEESESPSAP